LKSAIPHFSSFLLKEFRNNMKVICIRCSREFTLYSRKKEIYSKDSLCCRCRSYLKDAQKRDGRRKTNKCIDCGKTILNISTRCRSCCQLENRNHQYIDGHSSKTRTCVICGGKVTSGSRKSMCSGCYTKTLLGKSNPNYKFGHYTNNFCSTVKYKQWKKDVMCRDAFSCQICNNKSNLYAHHIKPKRNYPELVYDVSNGITLCKTCHENTFGRENEFVDFFVSFII
jgi:hypothetical protein